MKAVVTGGAGFIGGHLVALLREKGWSVKVIDKRTGRSIQQIGPSLDCKCKVDAIFHLAAPVGPVGVLEWAGGLVPEVVHTSRIAATWALERGCPLINVSTSEVYGSGGEDREDDPCTFQAPNSARKEYALAKLAAETMLANTAGLDVRTVRPFNVTGPGQLPDGGFVLPRFVRQALTGAPLTVYAPGTQLRAFGHVTDIAEGIWRAYVFGHPGEVYNLGVPANASTILQLAEEVIAAVGSGHVEIIDPVVLHGPAFREAPDKLPNGDKARRELGWDPKRTRAEVIADTIAYWRPALRAIA